MSDSEMRAYLLGQATEQEASRLEARVIEDEDTFAALKSVEDDLFDEFARGTLRPDERARFIEKYGHERDRLLVAHALAQRSASAGEALRASRRPWLSLAAAAVLLVAAGAALWRQNSIPATTPQPTAAVAAPPKAAAPAVLALTLATSRSAQATPTVALQTQTAVLELHIGLDPADQYDRYVMELRSGSDRVVWQGEVERTGVSVESGRPTLVAAIPARDLTAGAYELAVQGANAGRSPEPLGFAAVSLTR